MTMANNSIIHLEMRFDKTVLAHGTGVLYEYQEELYIVTAWHNLTGRNSETLEPINSNGAVPNNVLANIAVGMGEGHARLSYNIPLSEEERSSFLIHPLNYPRIDVAIIPLDLTKEYNLEIKRYGEEDCYIECNLIHTLPCGTSTYFYPIQRNFFKESDLIVKWMENVEVTEELFIPGYPHDIRDQHSQPIWKRATIASSLSQGWNGEPKFLVDTASKSGMSGAPVLYHNPHQYVEIKNTKIYSKGTTILAGIYVGRIGINGNDDPQIGTVWHTSVIQKIIDGNTYEKLAYEIELPPAKLKEEIQKVLDIQSIEVIENISNNKYPTRHIITHDLLKQINSRHPYEETLKEVLSMAETHSKVDK